MIAPLPPDLIWSFAQFVLDDDVADYISLRAVCREWRLCTTSPGGLDSCFRPRHWIMLPEGDDADLDKSRRRFLNLSTGRCLILHLPELHTFSVFSDSDGLLFLIDLSSHAVRLFNPFTRHLAHLPTFPFYSGVEINFSSSSISTGSCPTVMLLNRSLGAVYFAKPGDTNWVVFQFQGACPSSMLCFRDQFYLAHPSRGIRSFHVKKRSFRLVIPLKRITLGVFDSFYLAEFNKEMLLVHQKHDSSTFSVYRVDLESTGLVPMFNNRNLGIFLGKGYRCFALSLNGLSSLQPNSIYYCEAKQGGRCSITLYNMDDQAVESPTVVILHDGRTLAQNLAAYCLSSY